MEFTDYFRHTQQRSDRRWIAVDVTRPVAKDNPLRQVSVNTHYPAVVHLVPPESLLIVETKEAIRNDNRFQKAVSSWLPDTWRSKASPEVNPVMKGRHLYYLNPFPNPL